MKRLSGHLRGLGGPIVISDRPVLAVRYGLHWAHAPKGGGPCLKSESSWRTISGLLINAPFGAVWIYFRRWGS